MTFLRRKSADVFETGSWDSSPSPIQRAKRLKSTHDTSSNTLEWQNASGNVLAGMDPSPLRAPSESTAPASRESTGSPIVSGASSPATSVPPSPCLPDSCLELEDKPQTSDATKSLDEAVLMDYMRKIYSCYPIMRNICQWLSKVDIFNLMLVSKEMERAINPPHDRRLITLITSKLVMGAEPREKKTNCSWCLMEGRECCYCQYWSHLSYQDDFNTTSRRSDPTHRLAHLCHTCTMSLPPSSSDGRCLCNTKDIRYICQMCSTIEQKKLQERGQPWYIWTPAHMDPFFLAKVGEEYQIDYTGLNEETGGSISKSDKTPVGTNNEKLRRRKVCEGLDISGRLCRRIIESPEEGKRTVRCCTWCGMVAVDDPQKTPENLEVISKQTS